METNKNGQTLEVDKVIQCVFVKCVSVPDHIVNRYSRTLIMSPKWESYLGVLVGNEKSWLPDRRASVLISHTLTTNEEENLLHQKYFVDLVLIFKYTTMAAIFKYTIREHVSLIPFNRFLSLLEDLL